MSLASWKKEFYAITALGIVRKNKKGLATKKDLILHAVAKWRGLRKENLEKHELVHLDGILREKASSSITFSISSVSCSLCEDSKRKKKGESRSWVDCKVCPLTISRGGTPCDEETEAEFDAPYWRFKNSNDPEPMIEALKDCLNR